MYVFVVVPELPIPCITAWHRTISDHIFSLSAQFHYWQDILCIVFVYYTNGGTAAGKIFVRSIFKAYQEHCNNKSHVQVDNWETY